MSQPALPAIPSPPGAGSPRWTLESEELTQFLNLLFVRFGLDFRGYAYSSIKRRIAQSAMKEGVETIAELERRISSDPVALQRLYRTLTVHVTSMFRDPAFFRVIRDDVVPIWRTIPFIRIWIAGCSSGEEVYSLAILLHEEGLYKRCRIYATDLSDPMLAKAREGIFPLSSMRSYTQGYHEAGGTGDFSDYYTADMESVIFRPFLRENVIFAAHNLVGDSSFNEFHGIFCRNVMIYFNRDLQARVHQLFFESLADFGYLALGKSETIQHSPKENNYEPISARERIFRKIP